MVTANAFDFDGAGEGESSQDDLSDDRYSSYRGPYCMKCNPMIFCSYIVGLLSTLLIVGGSLLSLYYYDQMWLLLPLFGVILIFVGAYMFYFGHLAFDYRVQKARLTAQRTKLCERSRRRRYAARDLRSKSTHLADNRSLSQLSVNMIPQYFSPNEIITSSASSTLMGRSILRVHGQSFLILPLPEENSRSRTGSNCLTQTASGLSLNPSSVGVGESGDSRNVNIINKSTTDPAEPHKLEHNVIGNFSHYEQIISTRNSQRNHSQRPSFTIEADVQHINEPHCNENQQSILTTQHLVNGFDAADIRLSGELTSSAASNEAPSTGELIDATPSASSSSSESDDIWTSSVSGSTWTSTGISTSSSSSSSLPTNSNCQLNSFQRSTSFTILQRAPNEENLSSPFTGGDFVNSVDLSCDRQCSMSVQVDCDSGDDTRPLIEMQQESMQSMSCLLSNPQTGHEIDDVTESPQNGSEDQRPQDDEILLFNDDNVSIDENLINTEISTPPPSYEEILMTEADERRSGLFGTL